MVEEDAPSTIHTMRKTTEGRQLLAEMGRTKDVPTGRLGEFIAWDGEGINTDPTNVIGGIEVKTHNYVLFGSSAGRYAQVYKGRLTTKQCLQLMLRTEYENPTGIHVGFAFNYDVEKILTDLPADRMARLYEEKVIRHNGYRIEYYPSKWFQVSGFYRNKWTVCKIWDIFGFFQTSFVNALRDMFGGNPEFDAIESGKHTRNVFKYEELDTVIKPYWRSELVWLVKMISRLRDLLHKAGLPISSWHGPGAIASYGFKKYGIRKHMNKEIPEHVGMMARYGFAGGRFEPYKIGRAGKKIYRYDLNSAHPAGMAKLPSLAKGEWYKVNFPGELSDFGIYHVLFDFNGDEMAPMPFFHRDKAGLVRYPMRVSGYYWQPEILAVMESGIPFIIVEGWELDHDGSRPFEFIYEQYKTRQEWKAAGEAAQMAIKLFLNSLFGKTAQRVGWTKENGKIPEWHQLEYAGAITSNTRALLWEGLVQAYDKGALVSVDTDAVFSTEPLDLNVGTGLGQWGLDVFDDMVYLQNGIYWLLDDNKWKAKFRGLDKDSFTVDDVLRYFDNLDFREPHPLNADSNSPYVISGRTTRFVSSRAANHGNRPEYRGNWITTNRDVNVGTVGKRIHSPIMCFKCLDYGNYHKPSECFHDLAHEKPYMDDSKAHYIPWLDHDGMEGPEWLQEDVRTQTDSPIM